MCSGGYTWIYEIEAESKLDISPLILIVIPYIHVHVYYTACPKHSTLHLYLAMYRYWCFHVGNQIVLMLNTYTNVNSKTTAALHIDTMQKKC